MGRIRSILPEFPQSETIGRLSREARLLFIQIWTIVDDAGRARASPRLLASLLYPFDDDAPSLLGGWLEELERENCISLYTIDDANYLQVVNWLKHQRIDKPSKSRLPAITEVSADPREPSPKPRQGPRKGPRTLEEDRRGEESARAAAAPIDRNGEAYAFEAGMIRLNHRDLEKWKRANPDVNVESALLACQGWPEMNTENWFILVPKHLAKLQRQAVLEKAKIAAGMPVNEGNGKVYTKAELDEIWTTPEGLVRQWPRDFPPDSPWHKRKPPRHPDIGPFSG